MMCLNLSFSHDTHDTVSHYLKKQVNYSFIGIMHNHPINLYWNTSDYVINCLKVKVTIRSKC